MENNDEILAKKRKELREKLLKNEDIPLKHDREEEVGSITIPKGKINYGPPFEEYSRVSVILGPKMFGLAELGKKVMENAAEEVMIAGWKYRLIDCVELVREFMNVVKLMCFEGKEPTHELDEYRRDCYRVLYRILYGDGFYSEVKLIIGEKKIRLINLPKEDFLTVAGTHYSINMVEVGLYALFNEISEAYWKYGRLVPYRDI